MVLVIHMKDLSACVIWMAFLQPNFSTMCYVSVLMMLQSQDAICIHICTWPNVKSVYQIF